MEKDRNFDTDNRRKLKPWHGLLLFGIVMVSFYTIIAWAQMKWGMYGLALTELYLLLLSIVAVKLLKIPIKEIFPLEKPKWKKNIRGIIDVGKFLCPYDACDDVYGIFFSKRNFCG